MVDWSEYTDDCHVCFVRAQEEYKPARPLSFPCTTVIDHVTKVTHISDPGSALDPVTTLHTDMREHHTHLVPKCIAAHPPPIKKMYLIVTIVDGY